MSINAIGNTLSNAIGGINLQSGAINSLFSNISGAESHTFSEFLDQSIQSVTDAMADNKDKSPISIDKIGMPADLQYELFNDDTSKLSDIFNELMEKTKELSTVEPEQNNFDNKNNEFAFDMLDFNKDGKISFEEMIEFNSELKGTEVKDNLKDEFFKTDGFKNYIQKQAIGIYSTVKDALPLSGSILASL